MLYSSVLGRYIPAAAPEAAGGGEGGPGAELLREPGQGGGGTVPGHLSGIHKYTR